MIHSVSIQRVALGNPDAAKLRSNRRNGSRSVGTKPPHQQKPTSAVHISQESSRRVPRRMMLSGTAAGVSAAALLSLFAPIEAQAGSLDDLDEGARTMVMEAQRQAELLTQKNAKLVQDMEALKAELEEMKTYKNMIPSLKKDIEVRDLATDDLMIKVTDLKEKLRAREASQAELQQNLTSVKEALKAREANQEDLLLKVSQLKDKLKTREASTTQFDFLTNRNLVLEEAMKERDSAFSKIAKENNVLYEKNQKLEQRLEKTLKILNR